MPTIRELTCEEPTCGRVFTDIRTRGRIPKRCPECRAKDPKGHNDAYATIRKERGSYGSHRAMGILSHGEKDMLNFIQEQLGTSQSGAIKASIRAYAVILQGIASRDMSRREDE